MTMTDQSLTGSLTHGPAVADPLPASVRDQRILQPATRHLVTMAALGGMVLLAAYGFGFIVWQTIWPGDPAQSWMLAVLRDHYAATLGVPMSAAAALCVVLLLETSAGPIEIENTLITFKGAAAPIVLWVLCFLAMIFALGYLWVPAPA